MMRVKPPLSCEIEGRVAFYEVDPLQIVWNGNYFNSLPGHLGRG